LSWDVVDFYNEDIVYPLMHFFEPKSNNLYYIDVPFLEKQKQFILENNITSFKELPINIFKTKKINWTQELPDLHEIPRHHKSICIPEDCIILTGGLSESEHGKSN
jgi:hypothetical protein